MTIAVDFDGTIVEHKYPAIGREIPGAIDTLRKLAEQGHRLILWTVREGDRLDEAVRFCSERGLTFYAVNSETPGDWAKDGPRKIRADMFIDDCNIGGLPDWGMLYNMIVSHRNWGDYLYGGETVSPRRRRSLAARLIDRCSRARRNLSGGSKRRARHHW